MILCKGLPILKGISYRENYFRIRIEPYVEPD